MYLYSVLPSTSFKDVLLMVNDGAITDLFENFASLPLPFINAEPSSGSQQLPQFPPTLRTPTLELASSHLVCSVALTGVMLLQAGRWWAEQKDVDDDEEEAASQDKRKAPADTKEPVSEKGKTS